MVELRPLSIAYAPIMVEAAQESIAEINPWMPWCSAEFDIATAKNFINEQVAAWNSDTAYEFAVFCKDGSYLGGGGVNNVNNEHKIANIGYWIRTTKTGMGYGTATLLALVEWARANTQLNRLEVVVAMGNYASQRVAEKGGAIKEGVAKSRLLIHDQYHDANMYAFTKSV